MSRCFPFPPPGYEKKTGNDPIDLLTKEKCTEKKHKKEDKERKDKKDKERSKDKLRDKKDRKEKHKEKDKKKDKERDKDKNKTSDERKITESIESHNGEKISNTGQLAEVFKHSMLLEELGRRIQDERGARSQTVEDFVVTGPRRVEDMGPPVQTNKEKGNDRRQHKHRADRGGTGKKIAKNFMGPDNGTGEEMAGTMGKRIEGKGKNKDKEADDRRDAKHRNSEKGKKDTERGKETEKEKEKVKEKEDNHKKHDKLRESDKKEERGVLNIIKSSSKDSEKSAGNGGSLKKRKEYEMNGVIHENDIWPNKLPRPTSFSCLPVKDGKKLETFHEGIQCPDRQGAADSKKTDTVKENKVNGVIEARPPSVNLKAPLILEVSENGEASRKTPPHSDSKYLSQIYSIPKLEQWYDFNGDQEWLFGGDNSQKPKAGPDYGETMAHVWADALRIESADICALPYVVPY